MSIKRVLPAALVTLMLGAAAVAVAQTPPAAGVAPPPPAGAPPAPGLAPPPPPAADAGQPQAVLLLTPVAVNKMQDDNVVAVKGNVAEIFGNKFILQDDTGRALVDLGPRGEDGNVVTKGEAVTVQGRFDRGFIHAQLVAHADGRNQAFGPPARPRPPREADRGPGRRPPPPPAPVGAAPAAPAPSR